MGAVCTFVINFASVRLAQHIKEAFDDAKVRNRRALGLWTQFIDSDGHSCLATETSTTAVLDDFTTLFGDLGGRWEAAVSDTGVWVPVSLQVDPAHVN